VENQALKNKISLFERMQIESQSNCNRSCWFCPRTYDRSGKYLDADGAPVFNEMPTEKIIDLLDQARAMGFQGRVAFYHYSEPLLDKRNIMLAREARRRGMKPYLHTNGDVLRHDDALCAEVKQVYGLIVVGLYDYNTNTELEDAKRYWQTRLAGANLEFSPIGLSPARASHSIGIPRALVPSDSRMSTPDVTFSHAPCHRPLIRMLIQHDGEMCHCCEDDYGAFKLGNAYEHSLEELWFSERHVRIITELIAGHRQNYMLCQNCPLPPTGPALVGRKIEIAPRHYDGISRS
jgi:radical SAM protein with 4Fe4S-binding SPASM domain